MDSVCDFASFSKKVICIIKFFLKKTWVSLSHVASLNYIINYYKEKSQIYFKNCYATKYH